MKLKSLFLGSAAALALTSGALAADPRSSFVSLDVCDAYGITGLTIASSDTCLKISGSVSYEFQWGNYATIDAVGTGMDSQAFNPYKSIDDNLGTNDWRSRLEAILKFEATTQTDAGAAKAVIAFRERAREHALDDRGLALGDGGHPLRLQEAYVSFGDTTVLSAGRKGSLAKLGNDEPYNYLGLFRSEDVDLGVNYSVTVPRGGSVIQVVSEVADGVAVGAGLENLTIDPTTSGAGPLGGPHGRGTFVGFVEAKGAWGNAHATVLVNNVLDSTLASAWAVHTGATMNFDNFKVRGALAFDSASYWNGLISGEATFDLFTLAASAEFTSNDELGFGASAGFQATETIKINAGFRYLDSDTTISGAGTESWQAALQVVAGISEGIEVSGAIGAYFGGALPAPVDPVAYVDLGVTYKPGGGFETGVGLEANALGAYKVKFNAKKSF